MADDIFFQQPSGKVARFRTFDFYEKSDLPYYVFLKDYQLPKRSRSGKDMITVFVNACRCLFKIGQSVTTSIQKLREGTIDF